MSKEYFTRQREEQLSYSRVVKVKGGTTLYLAGVGGHRDAQGNFIGGAFADQARRALERLGDAIELAGGTIDDIVTMTVFITDSRYGTEFDKIRAEYFKPGHYPASALITVAGLAQPGMLVEIQAIGVVGD
jgi:enamine deaminase RidA (YjgF/YER057c/UK114 family)